MLFFMFIPVEILRGATLLFCKPQSECIGTYTEKFPLLGSNKLKFSRLTDAVFYVYSNGNS